MGYRRPEHAGRDIPGNKDFGIRIGLAAAALAATCSIIALRASRAQVPARAHTSHAHVATGVAFDSRLDRTISPLVFGGAGAEVTAGYAWRGERIGFGVTAAAAAHTLDAQSGESESAQRVYRADLSLALDRGLGNGDASHALAVGAALRGTVQLTRHRYGDPHQSASMFLAAAVSLGPSVSWLHTIGAGTVSATAAVPLVSVVSHSYSALKSYRRKPKFRVASPRDLHGFASVISFVHAPIGSVRVLYQYELDLMRYEDLQPLRGVSQALRIGVVREWGAR